MNRKSLVPAAAALSLAAGIVTAQAGLTGPARQPINNALDTAFDGSGVNAGLGVAHHEIHVNIHRPNANPTLDTADRAGQKAIDTAQGEVDLAAATANKTAQRALDTAHQAVATVNATVTRTAGTSGTANLNVPSPIGDARWNERQLLQRTIRFDAGNVTAHTVEVKAHRASATMYSLQVLVDGKQAGSQVNIYSTSLHLDGLDVPIFVPGAQGTIYIAVSYGYFSSGSTCLASIGVDDAACAASAPDPEGLAQLRPQVTTSLGWQMLGRPSGRTSIRTPLF